MIVSWPSRNKLYGGYNWAILLNSGYQWTKHVKTYLGCWLDIIYHVLFTKPEWPEYRPRRIGKYNWKSYI